MESETRKDRGGGRKATKAASGTPAAQRKRNCSSGDDDEATAKKARPDHGPPNDGKSRDAMTLKERFCQHRLATSASPKTFKFNKKRVRMISDCNEFSDQMKAIVYWMARDVRVQDNWAFIYAQRMALKYEVALLVCYCLQPQFPHANSRHCDFMLKGVEQVSEECRELQIPFHLLLGSPAQEIPTFVQKHGVGGVISDFSPLREAVQQANDLQTALNDTLPFCLVDAHNVVPVWEASPKQEYGARTIRRKITDQLGAFLTPFPPIIQHPFPSKTDAERQPDFGKARLFIEMDKTVAPVDWAAPGYSHALDMLDSFCKSRLPRFADKRNDPNVTAVSNLSPWFHHGHLSVQRAVLHVKQLKKHSESVAAFVEEAIIRRELADNFCFYNKHYDNVKGAADWAQKTLSDHRDDKRAFLYSRDDLEKAKTHDPLWNASQLQLTREGKMHGFLRMYWAKKILEWTESPEAALSCALYLNDRFSLDGNDPNGFVGCMWSICGLHDQGWPERAVFGKIRFMNFDGCKRKFDVKAFISRYRAHEASS